MRSIAIVSLVLSASLAHAGPHDALLAADPCDDGDHARVVALPEADGIRAGTDPDDGKRPAVEADALGEQGGAQWCAGLVTVDGEKLLFSSLVAAMVSPEDAVYYPLAAQWAIPMPDADALAAAKAGTLPSPAAAAGDADNEPALTRIVVRTTSTGKLAALAVKDLIVVGSAEGQILQGAAAKKALSRWNLDLVVDPHTTSGADGGLGAGFVIANVTATAHKKGATSITYRVLYGFARVRRKWKLALVHFAIVK